jgi:hypothetical protein
VDCDNYQPPAACRPSYARETWLLVLPAGALLIIRSCPDGGTICTCYFPKSSVRCAAAGRRWRNVVRCVLSRYAELTPEGEWTPKPLVDEGSEIRVRFRFRTPATWGMKGGMQKPWDAMPAPWQKATDEASPQIRLAPRTRY